MTTRNRLTEMTAKEKRPEKRPPILTVTTPMGWRKQDTPVLPMAMYPARLLKDDQTDKK